jgi:hypothetical protein
MAFLGGAVSLLGSLFGGHQSYNSSFVDPRMAALNQQMQASQADLMAQTAQDGIIGAQSQEQDAAMIGQSTRAVDRASALTMIVSRHEGLMQSIQQAENAHVKSAFDIVKQS